MALLSTTRAPRHPALAGVVELLWLSPGRGAGRLDRVIPTGSPHLVWRVGSPIRFACGQIERRGVLGGARSTSHVHVTATGWSVGAMLCPGAIPRLFGASARELAERHTGLDDLWGPVAARLQARLEESPCLDLVEQVLAEQLRPDRRPAGLVRAHRMLADGASVERAARAVQRTPRALNHWFHDHIGLSPRRWATVRRVRRAMAIAADEPDGLTVALRAGYADHPHLCRDFRAVTGITMGQWRHHRPGEPSHVAVDRAHPHSE